MSLPTAPFDAMTHEDQQRALAELAGEALSLYALGPAARVRLVNLSENATYAVDGAADGRRYALRLHRAGYHSRQAVASELAWETALRADGVVTTPRPVP